jgi:hypothetical protein
MSFSAWERIPDGVPQGSASSPLQFFICVNDLPRTINDKNCTYTVHQWYTYNSKKPKLKTTNMVTPLNSANKWFKVNLLSMNVDKTHYIKFKIKNKPTLDINIVCNNLITNLSEIKFLGIYIYIYIHTRFNKLELSYRTYYPKTEFSMLHRGVLNHSCPTVLRKILAIPILLQL